MRATYLTEPFSIELRDVAGPTVREPGDAVVRVVASCICGSDLWPYRGIADVPRPRRIGHEFVGIVEEVGAEVASLRTGDFVIAPFLYSDNTCAHCRAGVQPSCVNGGGWGDEDRHVDGGQGELVRVPLADGTLVATPEVPDDALVPGLLSLSDVMATGHHAAVNAGVGPGATVVVVGDGAVGLCGVLAAQRLGAERIVVMSRYEDRQAVARTFGATDVVTERGDDAVEVVAGLTDGVGADAVLECVGTEESLASAVRMARPGGRVGYVGVPHGDGSPLETMFRRNVALAGGVAPARAYLPELLDDVLAGRLDPSPVFDRTLPLAEVAEGYRAMHEREAIKVLLQP